MKKRLFFLIKGKQYKLTRVGKFVVLSLSIFFCLLVGELMVRRFSPIPLQKEYMIFGCHNYQRIHRDMLDKELFWPLYFEFCGKEYPVDKKMI